MVGGAPAGGGASTIDGVTGLQAALDAKAPTGRSLYGTERDTYAQRLRDLRVTSPNYLVLDDFTTTSGWSGTAAAETVDGSTTLRFTGAPGSNWTQKDYNTPLAITDDMHNCYIRFKVTDPAKFNGLRVYLYDASGANGYVLLVTVPTGGWQAGWQTRTFKRSSWSTVGTAPGWNALEQMRLTFYAVDSVNFDTVYVDEVSMYAMRPVCSLWFDDGHSTVYTEAFPRMTALGFTGSLTVVGGMDYYPGNHMNPAQHIEMARAGWDLSNHTYSHGTLGNLPEAQQRSQIARGLDMCLKLSGGHPSAYHLVPPNGSDNATTLALAHEYASLMRGSATTNTLPIADFYYLGSKTPQWDDEASVATGWIDDAITNQQWLILLFHVIGDGANNTYSTTKFQAIIDYLDAHRADIDTLPPSLAVARM